MIIIIPTTTTIISNLNPPLPRSEILRMPSPEKRFRGRGSTIRRARVIPQGFLSWQFKIEPQSPPAISPKVQLISHSKVQDRCAWYALEQYDHI